MRLNPKGIFHSLAMVAYFPSQDTVAEKVSVWFDKANECWEISEKEDRHILEKKCRPNRKSTENPVRRGSSSIPSRPR